MHGTELKAAMRAANVTLAQLAEMTQIHETTLSRACSGLILTGDKPMRIREALKVASKRAEKAARKFRESLTTA